MSEVPHLTGDEFRQHGHALVDWIADYRARIESLPVQSTVAPNWLREQLPPHAPEDGEPFDDVLADLERLILPAISHWQSPSWFAFFPANAGLTSVLGELASAGLGVQGMLWATSPACTELETHVLDWMAEALGLPDAFLSTSTGGGVIQDSASSGALVALVAARHRAGVQRELVAYISTQAHSSLEKGARVAGIDHLRVIDVDAEFALRPDLLEAAIEEDRSRGLTPFFVNATVGTTASLAVDPIRAIGSICHANQLWLHVDGAHAGAATLCPEHRDLLDGFELVDSYCTNAHKWLLVNFDCDLMWVRDRADLIQSLSVLPPYLRNAATESGAVIDYRDWQVPLGRRFRALKLWFTIRQYGLNGLRTLIREHVGHTEWLTGQLAGDDRFELAAPPRLSLVCFRLRAGDEATARVCDEINASGQAALTRTVLDGRTVIRVSIAGTHTARRHVEALWKLISGAHERLWMAAPPGR